MSERVYFTRNPSEYMQNVQVHPWKRESHFVAPLWNSDMELLAPMDSNDFICRIPIWYYYYCYYENWRSHFRKTTNSRYLYCIIQMQQEYPPLWIFESFRMRFSHSIHCFALLCLEHTEWMYAFRIECMRFTLVCASRAMNRTINAYTRLKTCRMSTRALLLINEFRSNFRLFIQNHNLSHAYSHISQLCASNSFDIKFKFIRNQIQ